MAVPVDFEQVERVVLDAGPLSKIAHPRKFEDITAWFERVVLTGYRVVVLGVTDYEVRRGLLRIPARRQLRELDIIKQDALYVPITDAAMQAAAHVWAEARRAGRPFTSDDRLDGDAILVAQVRALGDVAKSVVVTENEKHLAPFVPAVRWEAFEITHRS